MSRNEILRRTERGFFLRAPATYEVATDERPYIIGDQVAPWIANFSDQYTLVSPFDPESFDQTTLARREIFSQALALGHTTAYAEAIVKTGVLASRFRKIEEDGCLVGIEGIGNLTHDWRLNATILAELQNVSLYTRGVDTQDADFEIFVVKENDGLAKINASEEYVGARPLYFDRQALQSNPDYAFFNPDELYTGLDLSKFIVKVPATPELAQLALDLSVRTVLGLREPQIAQIISNHFKIAFVKNPEKFLAFNGHGDSDVFMTLSTMWAHSLIRHYWHSYAKPIEALIESGYFGEDVETASYVYHNFRRQFSEYSTYLHQDFGDRLLGLNFRLKQQGRAELYLPDDVPIQYIQDFMDSQCDRLELIKAIHTQPNPETGLSFYAQSYDYKGYPYMTANEVTFSTDLRDVPINQYTHLPNYEKAPDVPEDEKIIVKANAVWYQGNVLVSRINPWRSFRFGEFRETWDPKNIPQSVSGV